MHIGMNKWKKKNKTTIRQRRVGRRQWHTEEIGKWWDNVIKEWIIKRRRGKRCQRMYMASSTQ